MSYNNEHRVPSVWARIYSVWYRHERVYNAYLVSNSFPSILEPLIMLAALGFGLGGFIPDFNGISYLLFLASGLPVTTAMFTSAYECTYGTFVRLEYDKIYDGILGAPISPTDLLLGELLFAGTKGFLFSLAVLAVGWVMQIITYPLSVLAAVAGFLCGVMFASLSLLITSFVKNMNHFNFYFTGILSPMFFFSG
ncbi:MAG: ABC transporter permease, partial [Clostridia bacterium]|nr:ABC transporter permease [Clostridia bacterium]